MTQGVAEAPRPEQPAPSPTAPLAGGNGLLVPGFPHPLSWHQNNPEGGARTRCVCVPTRDSVSVCPGPALAKVKTAKSRQTDTAVRRGLGLRAGGRHLVTAHGVPSSALPGTIFGAFHSLTYWDPHTACQGGTTTGSILQRSDWDTGRPSDMPKVTQLTQDVH